jgi:lipopolysaccharide heptosyltransferase II
MNPAWNPVRRILCVRLDSLGDVLMCTPAMRALRQSPPARVLTLLTSPGAAAALPFIPELDTAIAWQAPWMKSSSPGDPGADSALVARLAAQRFDAAVIFTTYSQSALPAAMLCYLAGIPLRLAHCRENPYQMLSDWIAEPEPQQLERHEVQRQLDLVAAVGCHTGNVALSFALREHDLDHVRQRLYSAGINPYGRWILLHPGASAASRRYPARHWPEVMRQLAARTSCPLVLTGGPDEIALVDTIRAACPVPALSLAGQLSLGQLGAALRLASVVVTNNTGPAHIAAAVGTPLVDLYALTNPQHTPWQVSNRLLYHDVPCRFCQKSECPEGHHACLEQVAPTRVADAVCSLLDAEAGGVQENLPVPLVDSAGALAPPPGKVGSRIRVGTSAQPTVRFSVNRTP